MKSSLAGDHVFKNRENIISCNDSIIKEAAIKEKDQFRKTKAVDPKEKFSTWSK